MAGQGGLAFSFSVLSHVIEVGMNCCKYNPLWEKKPVTGQGLSVSFCDFYITQCPCAGSVAERWLGPVCKSQVVVWGGYRNHKPSCYSTSWWLLLILYQWSPIICIFRVCNQVKKAFCFPVTTLLSPTSCVMTAVLSGKDLAWTKALDSQAETGWCLLWVCDRVENITHAEQ